MLRLWMSLICLMLGMGTVLAQPAAEALKGDMTLKDRYILMKGKSQTYQDYKVIKEVVLDGVWKITQDSIKNGKAKLAESNKVIAGLNKKVAEAQEEVKRTNESVAETVFDSTHINVLGINLNKAVYITGTFVVIGALIFAVSILFGRMRWMQNASRERTESLDRVTKEFDEFKHKALEKQMKLSRELQNERNKLQELRSH